jgi:ATP-dependent DNA helicase RecQ
LLLRDALRTNPHGGLEFGPAAKALLKGEATLPLIEPPKRERRRRGAASESPNPVDDPLFEALRACRRDLAKEQGVPPYVIFHDSALREMAAARPTTLHALGRISGIGQRKLDAYGHAFLKVLAETA